MNQMSFDFLGNGNDKVSVDPASTAPPRKAAVTSRARPKSTRRNVVVSVAAPALTS